MNAAQKRPLVCSLFHDVQNCKQQHNQHPSHQFFKVQSALVSLEHGLLLILAQDDGDGRGWDGAEFSDDERRILARHRIVHQVQQLCNMVVREFYFCRGITYS